MSIEQLEDIEQLGRRAVACPRWRWMDGMLYKQNGVGVRPVIATAPIIQGGGLPDLTDPATLGCLLALVREAWGNPNIHMVWLIGGFDTWQLWNTERPILAPLLKFHTEAAALVAALEVAP